MWFRGAAALAALMMLAACTAPQEIRFPIYYSQCVMASDETMVCKAIPAPGR